MESFKTVTTSAASIHLSEDTASNITSTISKG